ncbi:MAG: hypothetical protein ABFC90_06765 [Bacteroidales bacterium]|nr:hypothetical protein [Bacteroidales bacterium]
MKSIIPAFLLILLSTTFFFSACSQDEGFASDPMDALRFSTDTLSFDTVFSTIGTTTAWLKIYNTGNRKIRISDIRLKEGTNGFRINVDGLSGKSFANVDIPAKDSLFLFVELTPSEQGSGQPLLVSDIILFQSNGGQKQIVLEAYSRDAVIWHGKTITSDTTLTSDKPFIIYDSLVVAKDVTLHITEGTTLHFHNAARLIAYGSIEATGSSSAPVTFRGDRLDDVLTDFPYDNYPGQWEYIYLAESSYGNVFDHVNIRGAYSGLVADSSSLDETKLTLKNSVIHNMAVNCIFGFHCKIVVANSQLTNSGGSTVYLKGGTSDFIHCTIANYQRLINREGFALDLVNYFEKSPLTARFVNCIVYGSQVSEVNISYLKDAQIIWDLLFKNCLVRTDQTTLSTYATTTDCIFSKDPLFLKLGTEAENYQYDFRIDSLSAARDCADITFSNLYPNDMNGVSRVADSKPDIGAYEWFRENK